MRGTKTIVALLALAAAGALAGGTGVLVSRAGEPRREAGKPGGVPSPAESAGAVATDALPPGFPASVPALLPLPEAGVCPEGWLWFDNPVARYSLCYPPSWGFSDRESPGRLDLVPGVALYGLWLHEDELFPWVAPAARTPEDAVRLDRGLEAELHVLQEGTGFAPECEPATPVAIAGLGARWCEDVYDLEDGAAVPRATGARLTLKVVIPLRRAPLARVEGQDLGGASLLVRVSGPSARRAGLEAIGWRIARAVRPHGAQGDR